MIINLHKSYINKLSQYPCLYLQASGFDGRFEIFDIIEGNIHRGKLLHNVHLYMKLNELKFVISNKDLPDYIKVIWRPDLWGGSKWMSNWATSLYVDPLDEDMVVKILKSDEFIKVYLVD
jgi:hypothetical protein